MRCTHIAVFACVLLGCVSASPKENPSNMDAKLLATAEAEMKRSGSDMREWKSRIELPGSAWAKDFFSESDDYTQRIKQAVEGQDYRAVVFSRKVGVGGPAVVFLSPKDLKILAVYRGR